MCACRLPIKLLPNELDCCCKSDNSLEQALPSDFNVSCFIQLKIEVVNQVWKNSFWWERGVVQT
jgi:hypothetical protein